MSQARQMTTPVVLRRAVSRDDVLKTDPRDVDVALGSFWVQSRISFESHLVKTFKECCPASIYEPGISQLCGFYADLIIKSIATERFDCVARVLSSSETSPEPDRPQSLLVRTLCKRIGAEDVTGIFYKSQPRLPMRTVARLCGPDALEARIDYILQDLYVRPRNVGERVLLVDDICNLGASTRVYAHVLKAFAGARRVVCVNLAATRFANGRDGRGMLMLDTAPLAGVRELEQVWLDDDNVLHVDSSCAAASSPVTSAVRFFAGCKSKPCPLCCKPRRKWWQVWRKG